MTTPPEEPTWATMAPAPKRRPAAFYVVAALFAFALLGVVAVIAYRAGAGSAPTTSVGASPTCDVIGVNGCTTKGANGGGPAIAPTKPPEHSPVPSSTPLPAPLTPPYIPPTIADGTWTVGQDFPAGTYRTGDTASDTCYWAITKSGTNGSDIVANHNGGGHLTVTLKVGQDFETDRCGTWHKV